MIYALIVIAFGVGLVLYLRSKHKQVNPAVYAVDIPAVCYQDANLFKSDGGVLVRSYIPVSPEALAHIEAGIAHTIRNTESQNWTNFRNLSDFQVFLVPPQAHNTETDPGSPALLLGSQQAAGTCIGVDVDQRYPSIVVPYEETELPEHAQYLENSVSNEAEHIEMWANNRDMFYYYTGALDQHPIFPDA